MTTTTTTIPAWINVDAIVDPELKRRADELTERCTALYDELLPVCREAMEVLREIRESVPSTDGLGEHPDDDNIVDGVVQLFDRLNGSSALFSSLHAIGGLFEVAADHLDEADLEDVEEVSK